MSVSTLCIRVLAAAIKFVWIGCGVLVAFATKVNTSLLLCKFFWGFCLNLDFYMIILITMIFFNMKFISYTFRQSNFYISRQQWFF